jgi:hypothetical protein
VAAFYVVLPVLFAVGIAAQPREHVTEANLGRPHEQIRLRTSDGLTLTGWYVPSKERRRRDRSPRPE